MFNSSSFTINEKKWTISEGGVLELNKNTLLANNIKFDEDGQEMGPRDAELLRVQSPSNMGRDRRILARKPMCQQKRKTRLPAAIVARHAPRTVARPLAAAQS